MVSDHERLFQGFPIRSVRLANGGGEPNELGAIREITEPGLKFVEEILAFEKSQAWGNSA